MQSRTNIIMSHGGRHGKGGTYLRGAEIDRATSEQVPNRLLTGNSAEAWAGEGSPKIQGAPGPRKATNEGEADFAKGSPEAKALLDAHAAAKVPTPAPTPAPAPAPAPSVDSFEDDEATTEASAETPDEPTSRRQLTIMRKAELIALADSVSVDSSGTADEIRVRLTDHFFGADDPEE